MSKYVKIMDVSAKGDGAAGKAAPPDVKKEKSQRKGELSKWSAFSI